MLRVIFYLYRMWSRVDRERKKHDIFEQYRPRGTDARMLMRVILPSDLPVLARSIMTIFEYDGDVLIQNSLKLF